MKPNRKPLIWAGLVLLAGIAFDIAFLRHAPWFGQFCAIVAPATSVLGFMVYPPKRDIESKER